MSKDSVKREHRSIIKLNSRSRIPEVVEYRRVLEEITVDEIVELEAEFPEETVPAAASVGNTSSDTGDNGPGQEARSALAIAYEKGYEAGSGETAKQLRAEYDSKLIESAKSFNGLVQQFTEEVKRYDRDFDGAVVTLAIAIAKKIVARDIDIEGAVITRVREALKKIIGVEKVKIHVNPADEEYVRQHRGNLSAYADSVREIVIEPDEKVDRGGCVIESELGNIDARVSTQFELIEEALSGLLKE